MITCEQRSFNAWSLTDEGEQVLQQGSHEAVVYNAVDPTVGTLQVDVMVSTTVAVNDLQTCLHTTQPLEALLCPYLVIPMQGP